MYGVSPNSGHFTIELNAKYTWAETHCAYLVAGCWHVDSLIRSQQLHSPGAHVAA